MRWLHTPACVRGSASVQISRHDGKLSLELWQGRSNCLNAGTVAFTENLTTNNWKIIVKTERCTREPCVPSFRNLRQKSEGLTGGTWHFRTTIELENKWKFAQGGPIRVTRDRRAQSGSRTKSDPKILYQALVNPKK